jgi:hypothetical protein
LRTFGTSALEGVKLVVATHWHDDHIRGLAQILASSPNAAFACSMALQSMQFLTLVEVNAEGIQGGTGVEEFRSIYDLLLARDAAKRPKVLITPQFAIQNRLLLSLAGAQRPASATITSLSPSDGTVRQALVDIAQLIPQPGDEQRRLTYSTPNKTSVVLWVEAGGKRALLGADLEHTGNPGEGWVGILSAFQPTSKATFFKIPHHGSPNAHCEEVWQDLLDTTPTAFLTPFTSGKGLPQDEDLLRLLRLTPNIFATARLPKRPPKRDPLIEKMVRHIPRRSLASKTGHVRIRWSAVDSQAPVDIEMFEGAYQVKATTGV